MKSNRFWTTEHNEAGLRRKPHVQHVSLRFVFRSRSKLGNNRLLFFRFCSAQRRGSAAVLRSRRAVLQPFQSESPSALLSEIGNPFSWTRFLASSQRGDREDDTLLPLDCNWNGTQLGFILISSWSCVFLLVCIFYLNLTNCCVRLKIGFHLETHLIWCFSFLI